MPGRTDNDKKNFWNIRIRKCEKHGLPLYDGESSMSGLSNQYIFSRKHSISNELNGKNFEQLSNSYHVSIMQPLNVSDMIDNNVASTSMSHNASSSLINR